MGLFKLCAYPGCCRPCPQGEKYCAGHKAQGMKYQAEREQEWKKRSEQKRKESNQSSTQRGYGYKWQQLSKRWRRLHPLCAQCEREGRITPAECVDHIVPHRGDPALIFDETNLQSLCWSCHSKKTAREDGGFGSPRKNTEPNKQKS